MIIIRDPAIAPFVIKENRQGFYVESTDGSFKPRKVENFNHAIQIIIEEKKHSELSGQTVSLHNYFKFSSDKEAELRNAFDGNTNNESESNNQSLTNIAESAQGPVEEVAQEAADLQQA